MHLVFAAPAARDLEDIIDYIALDNPVAAEETYQTLLIAARKLIDFPKIGRPGRLPSTRELVLSALPYLIVYEVSSEVITIIAIFHGAQDLARTFASRRKSLNEG